jgi:hypothetical protein
VEEKHIFFSKYNSTQDIFTTHQYTSTCAPVCIPRSLLVINVRHQGKNLCSPCVLEKYDFCLLEWIRVGFISQIQINI